MTKPQHILALTEVRTLLDDLAAATDRGKLDEVAKLYTPEARLITATWKAEGREAIIENLTKVKEMPSISTVSFVRHHLTTCQITLWGSDQADVRTYFQVITNRGLDHAGIYIDRVSQQSDGKWRVMSREVRVEYRAETSFVPASEVYSKRARN